MAVYAQGREDAPRADEVPPHEGAAPPLRPVVRQGLGARALRLHAGLAKSLGSALRRPDPRSVAAGTLTSAGGSMERSEGRSQDDDRVVGDGIADAGCRRVYAPRLDRADARDGRRDRRMEGNLWHRTVRGHTAAERTEGDGAVHDENWWARRVDGPVEGTINGDILR